MSFQEKAETWQEIFYLPDLVEMTEEKYKEVFDSFNTGIPYNIFHRNVRIAIEKARNLEGRTAG
jgi:hypothetical protein